MRLNTHLTNSEREIIQKMVYAQEKFSLRKIARMIGRLTFTVLRELN
ncbi:MAG: helix-turn-helix domain-containing protein [Spirochaetes bacterium]|nr:helix-turn-helix domain-containing protein [Spirochaetota bacterium]